MLTVFLFNLNDKNLLNNDLEYRVPFFKLI